MSLPFPLTLVIGFVFLSPSASFAQLNVITSGGFAAAYQELLPAFEKQAGITVTTRRGASQGSGPNTIPAQLRGGVAADVVIMSREGLDALIAERRIVPGSAVDLARSPLGVGVRSGLPKPDIRTVDAFKQMLLRAQSLNIVSTSAVYMREKLLPRLGIADAVAGKIKDTSLAAVVGGEVEVAVRPVSELVNVPGLDFVGPVPDEIQFVSVFSAAMVAGSKQTEAAKQLIRFLSSAGALPAIRHNGMEPARSR